ncbi:hypothetical protein [Paenibacillus sp. WLX2291]|uniref:hypothetical protein n=1 Tax=Paenibacillus sp. WLX2291 TaxID=3296934 RepID=UPI003983E06D
MNIEVTEKVPYLIAEFKQSLLDNMMETYGEKDQTRYAIMTVNKEWRFNNGL